MKTHDKAKALKQDNAMLEVVELSRPFADERFEHLLVFLLDKKGKVMNHYIVSKGTTTMTLAWPSDIFRPAIVENAHSIIVTHNHPSGDPTPSEEDVRLTRRLKQCGMIVGIQLEDHIIVARKGFYSLKAGGHLA